MACDIIYGTVHYDLDNDSRYCNEHLLYRGLLCMKFTYNNVDKNIDNV